MKKKLEKLLEDNIDAQIDHEKYYGVDYSGIAQSIVDMVVEKIEGVEVNYFLDAQAFIRKEKLINSLKQD